MSVMHPQYGGTSLAGIKVVGRADRTFVSTRDHTGHKIDGPIDGPQAATIHVQYHDNGRTFWRFNRKQHGALAMDLRWRRG